MGQSGNHCDVEAMREGARRRLPRFAFDFIDGGALRENALDRNRSALDAVRLAPRVLAGAEQRDTTLSLFGETFAAPFGIAPIGMAGLIAPGIDLALARAAADAGIPYALSTAGTADIETIAQAAPPSWFQLYVGRDAEIVDDLIRRADAAGCPVLIVTADVPAPGKRLRDIRNRFSLPLRPDLRMAFDVATHPGWAWRIATGGAPRFANLERYATPGASVQSLAELMAAQSSARLDWDLLARIRERWRRPLILKGVLRPDDAVRAIAAGVDGIAVSNHGGRQLDAAPAPIEALPAIRDAVGPAVPLIVDGGARNGEDIARARVLGADLVLFGRAFLYGAAALGLRDGPQAVIALLRDELDRAMTQLGCATLPALDRSLLFRRYGSAEFSGDIPA
jgi:isopentenyl diphosphate isomerase/L-lactate dehydrogenase-like FMN-dependent dehydrogenase